VAAAELDGLSAAESRPRWSAAAGDRALFLAYRASCVAQFANDLRQGDDAFARADAPARCAASRTASRACCSRSASQASERAPAGGRRRTADWGSGTAARQALRAQLAS
jgi:hypothetical protein